MTHQEPANERQRSNTVAVPKWALWVGIAVLAVAVLAGGGFGISAAINAAEQNAAREQAEAEEAEAAALLADRHRTLFNEAIDACDDTGEFGAPMTVRDEGMSLDMEGGGGSDLLNYRAFEHQTCVLRELDAPESVIDRMGQTRALDGTQEATWDDLIVHWTYHPDDGMNAVVEFTE